MNYLDHIAITQRPDSIALAVAKDVPVVLDYDEPGIDAE